MRTQRTDPIHPRDLWAIAGYAAFAITLLAPLRHYVGDLKKVTKAKVEHDSFPLSTYPMFSADRKGRIVVPHVIGFTSDGDRVIPHYKHFGTGGLNQVRKQVSKLIREGGAAEIAQRYADSIATEQREARTKGSGKGATRRRREAEIVRVAVVRSRFDFDHYFAGRTDPEAEVLHADCEIGGTAATYEAPALPRYRKEN